jgi:hypothetical protein
VRYVVVYFHPRLRVFECIPEIEYVFAFQPSYGSKLNEELESAILAFEIFSLNWA